MSREEFHRWADKQEQFIRDEFRKVHEELQHGRKRFHELSNTINLAAGTAALAKASTDRHEDELKHIRRTNLVVSGLVSGIGTVLGIIFKRT